MSEGQETIQNMNSIETSNDAQNMNSNETSNDAQNMNSNETSNDAQNMNSIETSNDAQNMNSNETSNDAQNMNSNETLNDTQNVELNETLNDTQNVELNETLNDTQNMESNEESTVENPTPISVPSESKETYAFQAEISQLMSLIINSFYSNKDIFLRELISNSSDALDKMRHEGLQDSSKLQDYNEFVIRIIPDKENKTLTIMDTGIGMTKKELIENLGTIARSGTKNFIEALTMGQDSMKLIGQFGVGFYSAYLVANNVRVITKHYNDEQYIWESHAGGSFIITKDETTSPMKRGTAIILHLKDELLEYLEEKRIKEIVKTHSEFINYPIELYVSKTVEKDVDEDEDEDEDKEENHDHEHVHDEHCSHSHSHSHSHEKGQEPLIEDVDEADEQRKTKEKKATKKVQETQHEWNELNKTKPIWTRPQSEVTKEEYDAFYKAFSGDWDSPLAYKFFSMEGQLEYRGVIFIPKHVPFDMFQQEKKKKNVKLYVRRVFIMDDSEELLPEYLNFVKVIIDSEDLPLNVSREMLQQNKIIKSIKKTVVKKCLEIISELDSDSFKTFYENFSKNLKLGVHEDEANCDKLMDTLRYYSNKSPETLTSLGEYVSRMKENQKNIYFITGESVKAIAGSPLITRMNKHDYEVFYMIDAIDEYATQKMKSYKEKSFVNISKDGLKLPEEEIAEKEFESQKTDYKEVCAKCKEILGDLVESINPVCTLYDVPCNLVTESYGLTANMERIMKAQAMNSSMNIHMKSKKILQLNINHPLIKYLREKYLANPNDPAFSNLCKVMYETSLIAGGFTIDDPNLYAKTMFNVMCGSLGLNDEASEDNSNELLNEVPNENSNSAQNESQKMESVD
jgi:molecular chaperone HtpG